MKALGINCTHASRKKNASNETFLIRLRFSSHIGIPQYEYLYPIEVVIAFAFVHSDTKAVPIVFMAAQKYGTVSIRGHPSINCSLRCARTFVDDFGKM